MKEVRKTTMEDVERVLDIFHRASESMHEMGIAQWLNGYPAKEDVLKDIASGESYVLTEDGVIQGTAYICTQPEPDYAEIEGKWLNEDPYVVIHRIAVDTEVKGKGYANELLNKAKEVALAHGYENIRIDTHEDNHPMRAFIDKHGFIYCGTVTIQRDGTKRRGYILHL